MLPSLLFEAAAVRDEGYLRDLKSTLSHAISNIAETPGEEYFNVNTEGVSNRTTLQGKLLRWVWIGLTLCTDSVTHLQFKKYTAFPISRRELQQIIRDMRWLLFLILPPMFKKIKLDFLSQAVISILCGTLMARLLRLTVTLRRRRQALNAQELLLEHCGDGGQKNATTSSSPQSISLNTKTCILCLSERQETTTTKCGHVACWRCLATWVEQEVL
eukprot:gene11019-3089_t